MGMHEEELRLHIRGFGHQRVRIPSRQAGVMSVVGYFTTYDKHYVIKLLRVRELRSLCATVSRPAYARFLANATRKESWYSPGETIKAKVISHHSRCLPLLRGIDRSRAYQVISRIAPYDRRQHIARLVELLYTGVEHFDFVPTVSAMTYANSEEIAGAADLLALVQEDVGAPGHASPVRITSQTHADPNINELLLLLALASDIADSSGIGLDLLPRTHVAPHLALSFPNVLRGRNSGLYYVDFFALGTPDGEPLERLGHRLLYARRMPTVRLLAQCLLRRQLRCLAQND